MKARKQTPRSKDKPAKRKSIKSQSTFVPRKSAGKPKGGSAGDTIIPRRKPVLFGANAGQD